MQSAGENQAVAGTGAANIGQVTLAAEALLCAGAKRNILLFQRISIPVRQQY